MTYHDDPEVFNRSFQLYMDGDIQQAYDLLTEALIQYPENAQRIYEWRMDMAAKMGKLDLAEQILRDALDAGCFYGEFALRRDNDMQVMQGRPMFERLVARSYQILAEEQKKIVPRLEILSAGAKTSQKPLFMALHGNSSNVEKFKRNWESLKNTDWLVALPQSSQLNGKDIYVWNDMAVVEEEIKAHFQQLISQYPVDPQRIIVSGFSKGGHAAISAVLQEWIPAAGFIVVAPYVGDVNAIIPHLKAKYLNTPRGYFLLGEDDHECTPGALQLYEELQKRDLHCEKEVFPGVRHEFPPEFDLVLQRAIKFITGK